MQLNTIIYQIIIKKKMTSSVYRSGSLSNTRFPYADALEYLIGKNAFGDNSNRVADQSFLASVEFAERYCSNIRNEKHVETLHTNVLGRNSDVEGSNYWVGNLNGASETRYEVLLGFSESAENKLLS